MSGLRGAVGAALLVTAVLLQVSLLGNVDILGARLDLTVLVVVSLALLSGSAIGAVYGFASGLLLDLAVGQPPGAQALVGTLVGYWCGRWGEVLVTDEHPLPPLIGGLLGTTAMLVLVPLVHYLVGLPGEGTSAASALVAVVLGGALVTPVYLVVRKALSRVTPSDVAERGGRAHG